MLLFYLILADNYIECIQWFYGFVMLSSFDRIVSTAAQMVYFRTLNTASTGNFANGFIQRIMYPRHSGFDERKLVT